MKDAKLKGLLYKTASCTSTGYLKTMFKHSSDQRVPSSKSGSEKRKTRVIVLNAFLCLFSLSGIISGTTAWFASNKTVEATGSSFRVTTPDDLDYDLYYLNTFTVNDVTKNGNYNPSINRYTGYEANNYAASTANFTKITYDENNQVIEEGEGDNRRNPTNITKLWPAHRLTYAIVTEESVSSFSLTDWSEQTSDKSKVSASTFVSISWAINMYGASYSVNKTNDVTADIKTAYATYKGSSLSDKFNYSQSSPAPEVKPSLSIVPTITQEEGTRTVLFFTLEFSDDEDTFYTFNESTNFYEKDTQGDSNCYENLNINGLVFKLT